MATLPANAEIRSARLITEAEWREHRLEALRLAPNVLDVANVPAVLLPYQAKLLATTAAYAVTVVEKSRRTGMTWAAAADAVLTSSSARTAGGMDSLYIGYNLDMAREFIDTCAMWARSFSQAVTQIEPDELLFDDGPDKSIAAFRIRFASGFEIVALASRPRSLRGRQGYVIIDEAAFHDDLDGVLQAAFALLIWGGKVLIISTHNGEENRYNRLIREIRGGEKPYALIRVDFDDALRDGLFQRICLVKGEEWSVEKEAKWRADIVAFYGEAADEELFCIPSEGGGQFLPAPLIEARSRPGAPVIRLKKDAAFTYWPEHLRQADIADWCDRELLPVLQTLDPQLAHYLGGDYGRVSDLTVLWPLTVQRTTRRTTPFVVELKSVPFDAQKQIQSYIIKRLPRYAASNHDATGLGFSLAEAAAQEFGLARAEPTMLNVEWYRENMQPLKTAFESDLIEIPADADIQSDLKLITLKAGVAQIPALKSGVKKDRHGDAAVALALAYYASRRAVLDYGYESAETLRMSETGGERARGDDLHLPERSLW